MNSGSNQTEKKKPSSSTSRATSRTKTNRTEKEDEPLFRSLQLFDSILQFLTRATAQSLVPISTIRKTIPSNNNSSSSSSHSSNINDGYGSCLVAWNHLETFIKHGVLQIESSTSTSSQNDTSTSTSTTTSSIHGSVTAYDTLQEMKSFWTRTSSSSSSSPSSSPSPPIMELKIGFPLPDERRLSGSTKAAAKRRMTYLKRQLKKKAEEENTKKDDDSNNKNEKDIEASKVVGNDTCSKELDCQNINDDDETKNNVSSSSVQHNAISNKDWTLPSSSSSTDKNNNNNKEDEEAVDHEPVLGMDRTAREALSDMLNLTFANTPTEATKGQALLESNIPTTILPKQASYAGSNMAQTADYVSDGAIKGWKQELLDPRLHGILPEQVYRHQALAIESALYGTPTLVCTGTGSGKSLCFLIPVLEAALNGMISILLFPTKALAQDQVVKLQAFLEKHGLDDDIRPATLDGDTPHSQRPLICETKNIILTNPDTLHAAILPNWKHMYRPLFGNLRFVVVDEMHMYNGVFGAHVAMILARLYRLACCCVSTIVFLACSATLPHPEHHFRLLCVIPTKQEVNIITQDASPRAAKHFFVWNPPILDGNGKSTGRIQIPKKRIKSGATKEEGGEDRPVTFAFSEDRPVELSSSSEDAEKKYTYIAPAKSKSSKIWYRRHSADETALLLARAVSQGIRCIAFCKTRCLVEWVFERAIAALKQSPNTAKLVPRVDSYRGGYTKSERRQIEQRLFRNELLGVVGTSALELGVDIGGVDLTLHCGFPSNHASLLQQAGRAGRGRAASIRPSLAICICFNSPLDQHLWRHPRSLLSRGISSPLSMPIYAGLVQGHLACAGKECPLAGSINPSLLELSSSDGVEQRLLGDEDVFGSKPVYQEALDTLLAQGSMSEEVSTAIIETKPSMVTVYKTHPSIKNPWTKVCIRSIEPISYDIVDTSHPLQGGSMDRIQNPAAVMDSIPYSRIFYHAFPGAIITHRTRRYKIISMTRPPALEGIRGSMALGAFAKPCIDRYFTRPLSTLKITVVKQMERVDLIQCGDDPLDAASARKKQEQFGTPSSFPDVSKVYDGFDPSLGSFAGCGVVNIKRNVKGYKKLSMVTREEFARSELSLPDMEYDSFGFWLDCDAERMAKDLTAESLGNGIHALSHAILACSPLFVPCTMYDVQCDHSVYHPTRVTIFDARAGGSGICAELWKSVFVPNGLVEAAIDLLKDCPSCSMDSGYGGGCPACIQAGECIKFNDYLCKSSGLIIAKHLLSRLKQTELYKKKIREHCKEARANCDACTFPQVKVARSMDAADTSSPRRKSRDKAMRKAKDIASAREKLVVVGRPSWPMDRSESSSTQENHE